LEDTYKKRIHGIVHSPKAKFTDDFYVFPGKRKELTRFQAKAALIENENFPEAIVDDAMDLMDREIGLFREAKQNRIANDNRPDDFTEWKDGDLFPEFTEPKEMAIMLFSQFGTTPAGVLEYLPTGVPKWISDVAPAITIDMSVKEHDVIAGINSEVRRYRRERSESEKESTHTFNVEQVLIYRKSVMGTMQIKTLEVLARNLKFEKKYKGRGSREIDKLVNCLSIPDKFGDCKVYKEVAAQMIKHNIWEVKRGLICQPTKNQVCLTILGRQGIGKSYAMDKIASPVGQLATNAIVADLSDPRQTPRWEQFRYIKLDEISKENKTSMSSLKEFITSTKRTHRPLFTNATEECPKWAACIATSNFPLVSSLKDNSGMRRHFELQCMQEANVLFSGLDDLDYELMYRGIDENLEYGYYGERSEGKKLFKTIIEIQDATRDHSPVEEFLMDKYYVDGKGLIPADSKTSWIAIEDLLGPLNIWSDSRGWKKFTPKYLRSCVSDMHLAMERKTGNRWYVKLMIPEGEENTYGNADSMVGIT